MACAFFKSKEKNRYVLFMVTVAILASCSEKQPSSYQGYVESEYVNISSSESGDLDSLLVTRGQQIEAGEALFGLESENEETAQRKALQEYNAEQSQMNDLQEGQRQKELDVIKAQLDQAIAEDKKSEAKRTSEEELYKEKVIPKSRWDETSAEAEANAARVRQFRSQLDVAKLPARNEQIKMQAHRVEVARAALEQAEWKLRQKAVKSPVSGMVFDTLYLEGESVPAGKPIVRILPPQNVKVRFFVPETLLGNISIGQSVAVHCDGCPSDIPAKITHISVEAEYTPPIIYSNETRSKLVFMIEAHPSPDKAAILHPGQPVEVKFQ